MSFLNKQQCFNTAVFYYLGIRLTNVKINGVMLYTSDSYEITQIKEFGYVEV